MNHYLLYIVIELIYIVTIVTFVVLMLRQVHANKHKKLVYQLVAISMVCMLLVALTTIRSFIEQDWGSIIDVEIISLAALLYLKVCNISLLKRLRTTTDDKTREGRRIDGVNIKENFDSYNK